MKKLFFSLALTLFAASTIFAQTREFQRGGERQTGSQIARLAEQLDLTEDQVAHLTEYSAQQRTAMQEQMAELESREEKQAVGKTFRDAWEAELEATLTPAQRTQMAELAEKRQTERATNRRAERPSRARGGERLELSEELNLTDEQKASLKEFSEQQRASMSAELEATEDQEAKQTIRKRYADAFEQKMQETLTEEQLETLEELRAARQENGQPQRTRRERGERTERS